MMVTTPLVPSQKITEQNDPTERLMKEVVASLRNSSNESPSTLADHVVKQVVALVHSNQTANLL
jgi:hypothetical protein